MSKLEIEFELSGLKLKIKGDSDDVSGKIADLQKQVQGVMNTIGSITQSASTPMLPAPAQSEPTRILDAEPSDNGKQRTKSGRRVGTGAGRPKADAYELKHDAQKWGFPKQEWNTAQKMMWLLLMLDQEANIKEATAAGLVATFKKYFREFGIVRAPNVTRDLGALKAKGRSVNNDPMKEPQTWFLLDDGKKEAQALVAVQATGVASATP